MNNKLYQIFVKTPKGTKVIDVFKIMTINELTLILYEKVGIPSEFYYLTHSGTCLNNNNTLESYQIEKESTINMNIRSFINDLTIIK